MRALLPAPKKAVTLMFGQRCRLCCKVTEFLTDGVPARVALYRLFHAIWQSGAEHYDMVASKTGLSRSLKSELKSLSAAHRAVLLLTAVEAFSPQEAAFIIDESSDEVEQAILNVQKIFDSQIASRVLIIEDEAIIAMDLKHLVTQLGHNVVAIASTRKAAVAIAMSEQPELILADVNLGEGGSGIDAVSEILTSFNIPVIFITAFPEKLLTGDGSEPTYLIAKPFLPETVQAIVSQALFFHPMMRLQGHHAPASSLDGKSEHRFPAHQESSGR